MTARRICILAAFLFATAVLVAPTPAMAFSAESLVTVGSPPTPYLPNGQNEPAVAMDANSPSARSTPCPTTTRTGCHPHGDPALAFGPRPGPEGFSWSNGSRLYYANLTFPLSTNSNFKGASAATVSRTDNGRPPLPETRARGWPRSS
jgi:hypothetical protein